MDLDRQVLALLAEHFLDFLGYDLTGTVVRVDDRIANFEVDLFDYEFDLEVVFLNGAVGNGVLLFGPAAAGAASQIVRSAGSGPRD
jgi:hypothetical protein